MLRLRYSSSAVALLVLFATLNAFGQRGFVHTRGKELVDGQGKPLLLKGTNFGNWMVQEGYMFHFDGGPQSPHRIEALTRTLLGPEQSEAFWNEWRKRYYTQGDVQFLKRKGFNSIRIPFHSKFFLNGNEEGFRLIDPIVAWAHEAGLYVILDMHVAPGGQNGGNIDDSDDYPWVYESPGARRETVDVWRRIAKHYANNPTVLGYDLLNEPLPNIPRLAKLRPMLEPLMKELTAAVRSVDKNHVVIITGANWDGDFSLLGPPFDANAMYTFHRYGIHGPKQDILAPYLAFREKYNVPIWLGESGENTDEWVADMRETMEKSGIGWAFWPYKKMDSGSCIVTFAKPPHWDEIVKYAADSWMIDHDHSVLRDRPSDEDIHAAFDGLLENIRFANEHVNMGYVNALIPTAQ